MLKFTWQTTHTATTCQRCKALDGYEWVFTDEVPLALYHPQFGYVWDIMADHSLAHGPLTYNCRCTLDVFIDDTDLTADLALIAEDTDELADTVHNQLNLVMTVLKMIGDMA